MWELDHKEGWAWKNWYFQAVVLTEKTPESPTWTARKPVNPKGNQPWIFIGRTDAEAETPNTWATWFEELTHWKRPWCWERLRAKRRRGWQRMRWLDGITNSMDMGLSQLREIVKYREDWRAVLHGVAKSQTPLRDWATTTSWLLCWFQQY